MKFDKLQKIAADDLYLKTISDQDRQFISDLFADSEVNKFYIVPKEAQQDYNQLIRYWLKDINGEAGYAWIIIKKGNGIFEKDKQAGFFTFEFRGNLQTARISYAIHPKYRKKGLITKIAQIVIDNLKLLGVEVIEADIDEDNLASQKVVEKLGFSTNKKQALIDPDMLREGKIRVRFLWKKSIRTKSSYKSKRFNLNAEQEKLIEGINEVIEAINSSGEQPELLMHYYYLLGRIQFNVGDYEESTDSFANCNKISINEELPNNHETFYWFGKIREAKGELIEAKMYLEFALEYFTENPEIISKSEILSAISSLK